MLDTKLSIADYVKRCAIPENRYHFHKTTDGRLSNYVPKVGQLMVTEGFEEVCKVIREPNSVKDFVVQYANGIKARKNLVCNDIEGFIDV